MSAQDSILDLQKYMTELKDKGVWREEPPMHIYAAPHQRVLIQYQHNSDTQLTHARHELAEESNVNVKVQDSQIFAETLCSTLAPHLTIRMLRDLVTVFNNELQLREESRNSHTSVSPSI